MKLIVRWQVLKKAAKDAWPAWLLIAGLLFAGFVMWLFLATPNDGVRYAGTILQALGLGTVAIGLRQTRQKFRHPAVGTKIKNWFKNIASAFKAPEPITLQVSDGVSVTTGIDAILTVEPGPDTTIEQRVVLLEQKVKALRQELNTQIKEANHTIDIIKKEMQRESEERQTADKKTNQLIEEMGVGGIHLEIVGLVWLFLGVILTSIPDEIGRLLVFIFGVKVYSWSILPILGV